MPMESEAAPEMVSGPDGGDLEPQAIEGDQDAPGEPAPNNVAPHRASRVPTRER